IRSHLTMPVLFSGDSSGEYSSSPACITFSQNIKQINSLKNERFLTVVENDNAENMPFLSC
ncbi:hypothetical protein, partial [Shigella dysenteriae]|uniref:hypothetical protein n=1 Tax=Shigella dysenteriae TaxID=622 RepID=UPI0019D44E6F